MTRQKIVFIAAFIALGTANVLDLLNIKFTTLKMIDNWFGLASLGKLIEIF